MKDNFEEARRIKRSARTLTDMANEFSDVSMYRQALGELVKARNLLVDELAKYQVKHNDSVIKIELQKIAAEIADCFGISGGIYRRIGDMKKAFEIYDQGYRYELDDKFNVQSSYNLGNKIILEILLNSKSINELQPIIMNGIKKIEQQIYSTRMKDWWAWADLAMLRILGYQPYAAKEAYFKMKYELGADKSNFQSAINVLESLQKHLMDTNPNNIVASIGECITLLRG